MSDEIHKIVEDGLKRCEEQDAEDIISKAFFSELRRMTCYRSQKVWGRQPDIQDFENAGTVAAVKLSKS